MGRMIISGSIREGDFLPKELELSAKFGISRPAVREALKVLAAKGLVTSRRRAGTRVMPRRESESPRSRCAGLACAVGG